MSHLISPLKEHRMKVFENMVLRGQFRPDRAETAGGQGKLGNEELKICTIHHILLGWANKEIEMKTCSMHGNITNVYTILFSKH